MNLQIINVVWGEKYIKTFLELSLPTQFSKGNLAELKDKPKYIIYTDEIGKSQITSSSHYKKLESACDVIFRVIRIKKNECSFKVMLKCHSDSIREANATSSPIVFISPDCIFSTGVFTYLEEALNRGIRLLAICSTRMSLDKYKNIIEEKEKKDGQDIVSWSSRELATITVQNLHYRAKCLFIKAGHISAHPSHIYWQLDENNILAKAFHLHPLLIWPREHNALPKISTDGKNFLEKICPNYDEWEVITDCSKISLFEISSDQQFTDDFTHPINKFTLRRWEKTHVSPSHHYFIKKNIILGNSIEKPEWEKIIRDANFELKSLRNISNKALYIGFLQSYLNVIKWYIQTFLLVISGKKKAPLKKAFSHLRFFICHKAIPSHVGLFKPKTPKHK